MAASTPAFGIGTLPTGSALPTDCAIQSVEIKESVDKSSYRDGTGVTCGLIPHKLLTREVTLTVVGKPALTGVVAGAYTESTLKMISAKFSEKNDGVPEGSVTYKTHETTE